MLERFLGPRRMYHIRRLIRHGKLTALCLFMTIVVFRGTIGAGKFGTPEKDFDNLRVRFHSSHRPNRVLGKVRSESARSGSGRAKLGSGTVETGSNSYESFDISKILVDEGEDEKRDPSKPYSLGPNISDWDEQRAKWLSRNSDFPNFLGPNKPRVLLVTSRRPSRARIR